MGSMTLCPYKEKCGSCGWSHIPYEKQLQQKLSDINGSFAIKKLALRCEEIIPSPKLAHYRNRMDFAIDFEGRVGLREKGKWWRVIDGHACFLADEQIETLFGEVRTWVKKSGLSFYDRKSHIGFLRAVVIRATTLGQTMVNIVTSATAETVGCQTTFQPLTSLIHSINHTDSDVSFGDEIHALSGPEFIEEKINGIIYRISPNAFFQTNPYASPLLLQAVKKFCGDLSGKTLLDLYCGTGFFSVALAASTKKTIGVELNAEAIKDAKINAKINTIEAEFIAALAESFDWSVYHPDVVILDPPRSGMHDRTLADLLRIRPQTIVYVSCNPKNFAREMVQLQRVYRVEMIKAIDLFPQTPHVELINRLVVK
jgi:23S rRNA (uracil-5-)-methyltransferase RumA